MADKEKPGRAHWLGNIGLSIAAVVVTYALLEGLTIAFNLFEPPDAAEKRVYFGELFRPDTTYGYSLRPNLDGLYTPYGEVSQTISTDSRGFRNADSDYETARVAFLGDSFTFGAWVPREETFYGRIGQSLGESVLTFGVGGYGFYEYMLLLDEHILPLKPQHLVLAIFANDLRTNPTAFDTQVWASPDLMYYGPSGAWTKDASMPSLLERSITYRALRALRNWQRGPAEVPPQKASDGTMLFNFRGTASDYLGGTAEQDVRTHLAAIIEKTRAAGIRLAVVLLPSRESAYRAEYERLYPETADYLDQEEEGYRRLCAQAAAAGLQCLDLTPVFRAHVGDEHLYFELDGHWNSAGHALAARTILEQIDFPEEG